MADITIYGIKNCDSMKKTFRWMNDNDVEYGFHDYKKSGADVSVLKRAVDQHGWEVVINKRGTTWRKLDDAVKEQMDERLAITIALDNPSIIKRPLIVQNGTVYIGFDADKLAKAFIPDQS